MKKYGIVLGLFLFVFLYYQLDYKRHFIYSDDETKVFTIWSRLGNKCYIIPGKYMSPFTPKSNFIETLSHRNYIGVIWNTEDQFDYKISIYNKYNLVDLHPRIKTYHKNDSLLVEYGILDSLNINQGKRSESKLAEVNKERFGYKYIDLNRVYGIKVFD